MERTASLSVFDVVFYLLSLALAILLAEIVRLAWASSRRRMFRLIVIFTGLTVVYLTTIFATKIATPILDYAVGSRQHSGDWFLIVDSWYSEPHGDRETIVVNFRLISRAHRGDVSEKGLIAYVLNDNGIRYDAEPSPSVPSFDVVLKPGETVKTTRRFLVRGDPERLDLVVAHHGFRRSWFVIGRTPFDGTSVVRLQQSAPRL